MSRFSFLPKKPPGAPAVLCLTNPCLAPAAEVLLEKFGQKYLAGGMKFFSVAALSLLLGLSVVCASPLEKEGGAKITKNEAEHIALKNHQGARVTAAKLEKIEGKKVWSIAIAQGKHQTMVAVDAMSGRILPVKKNDR
jgi:peptidase YpeB-like protein